MGGADPEPEAIDSRSPRADASGLAFGWGLSAHTDAASAAAQAAEHALRGLGGGPCDLAFLFVGGPHIAKAEHVAREVRERLGAGAIVGVSTEAVVGGGVELEAAAGVSLLAARMPGVRVTTFDASSLMMIAGGATGEQSPDHIAATIGAAPDLRTTILLADPFSLPLVKLLPELNRARVTSDGVPAGVIVGGLASGGKASGDARLILNDRVLRNGGVGVSIAGDIRTDVLVSQGATPMGENHIVTKSRGNAVLELGGRPALQVLESVFERLGEADQELVRGQGVLLGVVADEYKDRFGRADYLIRTVVGADRESGAIAVADRIRVGQTVRFHARDAKTAHEDLALLLDAQAIHGTPAAALLITCNQRGRALFGGPNHDAATLCRAFSPEPPGEQRAKGGREFDGVPPMPIAGFFASGEIGPAGDRSFMHGQTAVPVLFREAAPPTR
ncbi:MAG: FIST C-terminal domain-containing protein [Phycisphaeraceae bacterium]|nr:FIST C-terminal domain-containing protein [Phycisphaeraceae bacterium]